MFFGEYDYDLDMQVKAEEAREEGLAEGQLQKAIEAALVLIKDFNLKPEEAAQKMGAPLENVLVKLRSENVG